MPGNTQAISTIVVPLRTDISGFGRGLKEAATSVDRFYAGVSKTLANSPFGKATKAVQDFGKGFAALTKSAVAPLKPLADGLANVGKQAKAGLVDVAKLATGVVGLATAGIAATAAFMTSGLKRIGELGDQALSLGIASDKLSELQFAARATGASAEDLNKFLADLNATVHASIGNSSTAANAFKTLGTSAEELTKLSPDQQFDKLKKGFDGLATDAQKAQAAIDIGGEAGIKLFKLLGMSAAQFEALKQKSKDTGFTIKPEDLAKVQAANNAFSQIGMAIDGVINQLTVALAPAVTYVADKFTTWFAEVNKGHNFFQDLVDAGVAGFAKLADTVVGIGITFRKVFSDIVSFVGEAIDKLGRSLSYLDAIPGLEDLSTNVKNAATVLQIQGIKLAKDAKKAQESFDAAKPSDAILTSYDRFNKATEAQAKAQAQNTQATQGAVTANNDLKAKINDLKTSFDNTISDAGLTSEEKQIAQLKREGAGLVDVINLRLKAARVREAGKRDSLAEDLRESTKLPVQVLQENLNRINQLVKEGKLTQTQAIRGAAKLTEESGIADRPKLSGALKANSVEGRSYVLSQMGRMQDPIAIARRGLELTGQGNSLLGRILQAVSNRQGAVYSM